MNVQKRETDLMTLDLFDHFTSSEITEKICKVATPSQPKGDRYYAAFDKTKALNLILTLCGDGKWISQFEIFEATRMHPSDISCLILLRLVNDGTLEERHCYYGSDSPGKPGYFGFYSEYRIATSKDEKYL